MAESDCFCPLRLSRNIGNIPFIPDYGIGDIARTFIGNKLKLNIEFISNAFCNIR